MAIINEPKYHSVTVDHNPRPNTLLCGHRLVCW